MQSTRRMRLQSVIQEELSQQISRELKDTRIPRLTVSSVEVSQDGSSAIVFIAVLGRSLGGVEGTESTHDESVSKTEIKECLKGLTSASGVLRRHLAKVLTIRHVPELTFKEDRGFENAIRVNDLLKKISPGP